MIREKVKDSTGNVLWEEDYRFSRMSKAGERFIKNGKEYEVLECEYCERCEKIDTVVWAVDPCLQDTSS